MEHSDVGRLEAVEKYVLGELPTGLRDEFEEHFFDCAECADDVKHLTTFLTASRMVLEEKSAAQQTTPVPPEAKAGWFAWLRPIIVVPAITVLAAVVLFQNVVTIPALEERPGAAWVYSSAYHLQGATRGENATKITISPTENFALDFDFTPAAAYRSYSGNLLDSTGNTVLRFAVTGDMANKEMHIVVPAGRVRPGDYALVFAGEARGSDGKGSRFEEVQRIPFAIAFGR